jgi:hypothetical protein
MSANAGTIRATTKGSALYLWMLAGAIAIVLAVTLFVVNAGSGTDAKVVPTTPNVEMSEQFSGGPSQARGGVEEPEPPSTLNRVAHQRI